MLHYLFCDFCIQNIQICELSSANSPGVKRFPGQYCQIYHILSLLKFDPSVTFLPFKIRQIPNIFPSLLKLTAKLGLGPSLSSSLFWLYFLCFSHGFFSLKAVKCHFWFHLQCCGNWIITECILKKGYTNKKDHTLRIHSVTLTLGLIEFERNSIFEYCEKSYLHWLQY